MLRFCITRIWKFSVTILLVIVAGSACGGGGGGSESSDNSGDLGGDDDVIPAELPAERVLQGGSTTSFDRTALAFENPAPNLNGTQLERHLEGDAAFGAVFVSPPATFNAGLGPLFNNSSCEGCHTKNGRGQPVLGTGNLGSQALVRISVPGGEADLPGGPGQVPGLGTQLQDHAIVGSNPEGTVELRWETIGGSYGDGTDYELRRPRIKVRLSSGEALPENTEFSLRTPPPIFGLGLLEAVPAATIVAQADPDDLNQDGISGRPNMVWDTIQGVSVLGRFGRKANRPNLLQQSAAAYIGDIGVTNPIFPADDGSTEIDGNIVTATEFYTQSLGVPNAGDVADPSVKEGESLFLRFGCGSCHTPELRTGSHPLNAVANQRIFPYTDMLLHDMGEGLADHRADFLASGSEWKTPPLWGIGVTATILSTTATYLHDGRGRTVEEAILWHGGEAERAKERFRLAESAKRLALIRFLRSL